MDPPPLGEVARRSRDGGASPAPGPPPQSALRADSAAKAARTTSSGTSSGVRKRWNSSPSVIAWTTTTSCSGGVGTVGWPGAYGGWWQADPTDGAVMVFLAHNLLELERLAMGIGLDVYSAITEVHALATTTT